MKFSDRVKLEIKKLINENFGFTPSYYIQTILYRTLLLMAIKKGVFLSFGIFIVLTLIFPHHILETIDVILLIVLVSLKLSEQHYIKIFSNYLLEHGFTFQQMQSISTKLKKKEDKHD